MPPYYGGTTPITHPVTTTHPYINPDTTSWADVARLELHRLACRRIRITSDDLWDVMRRSHPDLRPTADPRCVAAIFLHGARERWITKTNAYLPSRDAICHGRPKRIWESLIAGKRFSTPS